MINETRNETLEKFSKATIDVERMRSLVIETFKTTNILKLSFMKELFTAKIIIGYDQTTCSLRVKILLLAEANFTLYYVLKYEIHSREDFVPIVTATIALYLPGKPGLL